MRCEMEKTEMVEKLEVIAEMLLSLQNGKSVIYRTELENLLYFGTGKIAKLVGSLCLDVKNHHLKK